MRPLHARPASLHTPLQTYHICSPLFAFLFCCVYAVEKRKAADSRCSLNGGGLRHTSYALHRKVEGGASVGGSRGRDRAGLERGSRVAGSAAYFEQFNDALSA